MVDLLDISDFPELEFILELCVKGKWVDIHNCYECYSINEDNTNKSLSLIMKPNTFVRSNSLKLSGIEIIFSDIFEVLSEFPLSEISSARVLDNFQRGHMPDKELKLNFLLEFVEGQRIEVICDKANLALFS